MARCDPGERCPARSHPHCPGAAIAMIICWVIAPTIFALPIALTPRTFSPAPPTRHQPFPRAPRRTAARASPATFRPSTLSPYGERSAAPAHGRGREPTAVCGPQGKRARHSSFARTDYGAIERDVTTGTHAAAHIATKP